MRVDTPDLSYYKTEFSLVQFSDICKGKLRPDLIHIVQLALAMYSRLI